MFHALFNQCQPHAAAFDLIARLQGLKDAKDPFVKAGVDAGAVVTDAEFDKGALRLCADLDNAGGRLWMMFAGIANEIAENHFQRGAGVRSVGRSSARVTVKPTGSASRATTSLINADIFTGSGEPSKRPTRE